MTSPSAPNPSLSYLDQRLRLLESHLVALHDSDDADESAELVDAYLLASAQARPSADLADEELPSLERLRRRFALSDFEENTLLLVLAPYVEARFGELIARAKHNAVRTQADIGLALALFAPTLAARMSLRAAFAPRATLLAQSLVNLEQRGARDGNLLDVALSLPPRVQALLLDSGQPDPRLEGFSRLVRTETRLEQVVLPAKTLQQVTGLIAHFDAFRERRRAWGVPAAGESTSGLVLLFSGPPGTGKTLLAQAVAHSVGAPLLLVDANQLQSQRELEANLATLLREARLQRAVLFFDDCELLFGNRLQGNHDLPLLLAALDRYEGITLLATNLAPALDPALDRRITLQIDFDIPPPGLRERIWRLHLPPAAPLADDVDFALLAEKFEFSGGHIKNSMLVALNRALARGDGARVSLHDFEEAARSQVRHRLKNLADRSTSHLTLDDLILPADIKDRLRAILAAVRNRRVIFDEWGFGEKVTTGKGICVLFRGDSGTGKTLAAEILAHELSMALYRVRIPSIVSKYVGETEKNLERCFREASLAGAMLLFDEADSIFSKRTEVNNSNDRYSNMEINLLLQEVERFEGIVILTTNLDAAIDDAFERRLNHKIDFPFPDAKARARIWRHLIPAAAPVVGPINYAFLGEDFELSGGSIKNAVIRAAYSAAERKTSISMELLEQAGEQEYRELGKLVPTRRNPWDE